MPKFKEGEVAILCNLIAESAKYNGEEVIIVEYLGMRTYGEYGTYELYSTKANFCNEIINNIDYVLKKKKPPEEEIDWVEKLNLKAPNKETQNAG